MKQIKDLTGQNVWCISDPHFRHANIIRYTSRPFNNVNEMDETMFNNWNDTISDDDTVLFLGDFVIGSSKLGMEKGEASKLIYDNLNGKEKIFIRGNHDTGVTSIPYHPNPTMIVSYNGFTFTLSHHPLEIFTTDYLLHGHIHNSPHPIRQNKKAFNCGVEDLNYKPINLNDVLKILQ